MRYKLGLSNAEKKEHGDRARKELGLLLSDCVTKGTVRDYKQNFRIGRSEYSNDKQFLAPFLVSFPSGERWILYTTTSMRSDRVKGQQWDAGNIKTIVPSITRAILCYPDGTESRDVKAFVSLSEKINNKEDYSAIDWVLSYRQLISAIDEADRKTIRFSPVKRPTTYMDRVSSASINTAIIADSVRPDEQKKERGRRLDAYGREFERIVADAMTSEANLRKWKGLSRTDIGKNYDVFEVITEGLKLSPDEVVCFSATSDRRDIGFLPSGGQPKTDVIVSAHFNDGTYHNYTISCKRSSRETVSVHQYTAETFSQVLNPDDEELSDLLNAFQTAGSKAALGEQKTLLLQNALEPYRKKLFLWVLGGIDGDGNPDIQWADYLLVLNSTTNKLIMHSIDEYYDYLIAAGVTGMFGTPFGWTYPSKQRGKYIQLKCKLM